MTEEERICLRTSKISADPATYNRTLSAKDEDGEFEGFRGPNAVIGHLSVLPDHGISECSHLKQSFAPALEKAAVIPAQDSLQVRTNAMNDLVRLRVCDPSERTDYSRKMQ